MVHTSSNNPITRGKGLFESLLARLRARQANLLIPDHLRNGRILDIGCGSFPYFLSHTYFKEKYAIDQLPKNNSISDIRWLCLDLNGFPKLPFPDNFFQAITMLAVVEHLSPASLVELFQDIHRALQPNGVVIITTLAAWSDGLLRFMAQVGLVSQRVIQEHVYLYTLPLLGWYVGSGDSL